MLSAFSSLSQGGQTFGTEETQQAGFYQRSWTHGDWMACKLPFQLRLAAISLLMCAQCHFCLEPSGKLWSSVTGLLCTSQTLVRAYLLRREHTVQQTDWCLPRSQHRTSCFQFCCLYILPAQPRSGPCRKVNGVKSRSELWHRQHLERTASRTLWSSEGKPRQQVQFIFTSELMVSALLCSMYTPGTAPCSFACCKTLRLLY